MPRSANRSNYITSARVARMLGITKRTLHNWVKAGRITPPEINPDNGYLQWTMSDVDTVRHVLTEDTGDSTRNR
jgi:DNA-binding transcriptional MerR regulator